MTPPEIAPALVERMVALVRRMGATKAGGWVVDYNEARAIVALLPELVDPDLLEARKIAHHACEAIDHPRAGQILNGTMDDNVHFGVPMALAALKRGRELEASK